MVSEDTDTTVLAMPDLPPQPKALGLPAGTESLVQVALC
jgi:hypothetical protein